MIRTGTSLHEQRLDLDTATALRPFFARLDHEQFIVCCLDAKHAIIGVNVVSSIGSLTPASSIPEKSSNRLSS